MQEGLLPASWDVKVGTICREERAEPTVSLLAAL